MPCHRCTCHPLFILLYHSSCLICFVTPYNGRRPFWDQSVLLSEAIYHVCYARKPRNCLIIDVVINLYSITLLMSLHSRVRYIRTHISALPCESVSEPSQSQLVRRVCTYIHTQRYVYICTYLCRSTSW